MHPANIPVVPTTQHGAPNESDLGLTTIVRAIDLDGHHSRFISEIFSALNTDPTTIRYRQDILDNLLQQPDLAARMTALLPHLRDLIDASVTRRWGDITPLLLVSSRLAELDNYVRCVEELGTALDEAGEQLYAEGLLALRSTLEAIRAEPTYMGLVAELPGLRSQLDQASSITLGINLDTQLLPESATIVSINSGRFTGKGTLLDRLLGERVANDTVRGITALYKADAGQRHTQAHELFRDMSRLLERVATPVATALDHYRQINTSVFASIEPELTFYLGAVKLVNDLRAHGLAFCRPEFVDMEAQTCVIEGSYSLDLALRLRYTHGSKLAEMIVSNVVHFDQGATISILTGPNSGGKTTYIRGIGQAQVLFQAGLLVPGDHARMSPVSSIFTHFAVAERLDIGGGRLAEELERMADIFAFVDSNSLVLLNEPFASTDHGAARVLSRDLLAGLQLLGARAVFVTHLYELVDDALANDQCNGVVSLVAGATSMHDGTVGLAPTYKIERGRPQILGYATELARRYGLSRDQIEQVLKSRGVIHEDRSTS